MCPLPDSVRPAKLSYFDYGFQPFEMASSAILVEDALKFSGQWHGEFKNCEIVPTDAQWQEFRNALDAARVWNWHKSYPPTATLDGGGWALSIVYSDRQMDASATNNYPNFDGTPTESPSPSPAFKIFYDALLHILEGGSNA